MIDDFARVVPIWSLLLTLQAPIPQNVGLVLLISWQHFYKSLHQQNDGPCTTRSGFKSLKYYDIL